MVTVFAREITDELASLVSKADEFVTKNKAEKAAAFIVLLTDDPDAAEEKLRALQKKTKAKIPLTIFDGKTGPRSYKIGKDADVTVLMWKGRKVKANHAYKKGEMDKDKVAEVMKSTKKILE